MEYLFIWMIKTYDCKNYSLSWLGTCTLINKKKKRGRVKLVYGLKYNFLCKIKYDEG
jgi:hypothetical protein